MRFKKINPKLFVKNRNKLAEMLPHSSLSVVVCNDQMPRNGDQNFPYRQNSDFFYLTGINQEKSALIIEKKADGSISETLFIMKFDPNLEKWEGKKLSAEEAMLASGINNIEWIDNFFDVIKSKYNSQINFYYNIYQHERYSTEVETRDKRIFKQLGIESFTNLNPLITKLRQVKEPEEIEAIKKAIDITGNAFLSLKNVIKPGVTEYEIEAELIYQFIKQGANGHAFDPIVASGKNACFLHYVTNEHVCNANDLLLIDFGAELNNYNADCSRTFPVAGEFTKRQQHVYRASKEVFDYAKTLFKPSTTINQLHANVCKFWTEKHIELGLYTSSDLKADKNIYKKYFPHGTSHFLGIDVHDVGSKDDILVPGMVLTCEPGIYIDDEGIGIRIENDILITENGYEDLMEGIPFLL